MCFTSLSRYKVEPIESTLAYQTFFQKSTGSYRGTASKSLLGLYAKALTREMPGSEFQLFQVGNFCYYWFL